jgi:hypothetical protein
LVRVSKRPRIDISNVSRIDSKAYTSATENIHATLDQSMANMTSYLSFAIANGW